MADVADVARFLEAHPPFTGLSADQLESIAATVQERAFPLGETALIEDGTPASVFYVIATGSMELVHEEEVIDILEPGEAFGHPSLLTGLAPAFTVRAHEDSLCYVLGREAAIAALARPAGVDFIAQSMRERLTRTGHTVHALPGLATVRLPELVSRQPLFCEPDTTIRDAAAEMTAHGSSAILVPAGERLSIVTDADLRARVVAGDVSRDDAVSRIAGDAVRVGPDRLAVDAVVDMLESGVEHLVVEDRHGAVLGIVSAADVMGFETWSPFALRHAALRARDEEELVRVAGGLRRLFVALLGAGLPSIDIGRVLSLQLDSLRLRLIDFAIARHGPAPVAWAWLVLGSAARREFTLGSDQENALAYADPGADASVDAYFERFAQDVNAGLERCGFLPDLNGVLARNRQWRMSEAAWIAVFRDCLVEPDNSHLIRATVSFDFRQSSGGLEIVAPLLAVIREAPEHPLFLRQLGRTAADPKPPLRFPGAFALDREGKIDIKRRGIIPIVNLARFHAITNRVTISATVDRFTAAAESGALEPSVAEGLIEAFGIVMRIRLQHHAAQIEAGGTVGEIDNMIDPDHLPPIARRELREAFRVVALAQKRVANYGPQAR
ncbi:MAG TPA: putative nucleotidyltransferase substrate binding domain-containing protein [Solirubrobacteraceae bacterium]|nr:putative nucleotidyltransferase substrate binding domain-containing protein [Solirubrobacteraceae bacterium]